MIIAKHRKTATQDLTINYNFFYNTINELSIKTMLTQLIKEKKIVILSRSTFFAPYLSTPSH